jgi:hypothetical protein
MTSLVRLGLFAGIAAAAGCGGPTRGWGVGGGTVTKVEGEERISCSVDRLTCDGRAFAVLAANGSAGTTSGGGSGDFRGAFRIPPDREVAWSCKTADGKSGKVVIDGAEFDLASGGLFLVDTRQKPAKTEQLTVPADRLQEVTDARKFPDLATADSKVAAFLEACKTRP